MSECARNSPRVLVVDDCRISSLLMRHILKKEGMLSDAAASGSAGLEKALSKAYDIIFLDLMLPDMSGFEVARRLREHPFARRPTIYVFTAGGEHVGPERCMEMGLDGFFQKPIVPSQVAQLAQEALAGDGADNGRAGEGGPEAEPPLQSRP
jgi:CheY-like chemotaxis protein